MKRVIGVVLIIAGFILAISSQSNFTGAVAGIQATTASFVGVIFCLIGILFISGEENLEEKIKKWKKYSIKEDSIYQDIEHEYLGQKKEQKRTAVQEKIEQTLTKGKLIEPDTINKKHTYKEQFYEGHAALGGRIIDAASHIIKSGKNKGKLIHFGQPANSIYLWVVDEDFNFILANRKNMQHPMPQMKQEKIDYHHRKHKLPHATLAKGKKVYGSGEVLIEGGKVKWFNTSSGHYIDMKSVEEFNKQGKEVFNYFVGKFGWKEIESGAKYKKKD